MRSGSYSSASSLEHGHHIAGDDPGALLMHRLRLDGFVYLESTGGTGFLATRPLFLRSGDVRLNIQAAHKVREQVTDPEGRPIRGVALPPSGAGATIAASRWSWRSARSTGRAL